MTNVTASEINVIPLDDGVERTMTELLPCPCCGNEAVLTLAGVSCAECPMTAVVGLGVTEAEAIEAWNTRAERTCENKVIGINKNTPVEFRTDNFICSACGEMFFADNVGVNYPIDWAYCPNCGAKVTND